MAMEVEQSIKEEPVSLVTPDNDEDEDDLNDDRPVRRPMNAFLLFCKRHRTLVKERHPWLDNRSATKMLADMWAVLDSHEKEKYLELARQCKAAFLKAYPDYKWCGTSKAQATSPTSPTVTTRKMHADSNHDEKGGRDGSITPGKLADPADMGGLNLLLMAGEQALSPNNNNNNEDEDTVKVPPQSAAHTATDLATDSVTDHATDPVTDPVTDPADDKSDSSGGQSALLQFAQMCSEQPSFQQRKSTNQQKAKQSSANGSQAKTVNQMQSTNDSTECERTEKKKKKIKKHKVEKDKDSDEPDKKKKKALKMDSTKDTLEGIPEKSSKKKKKHGEKRKKKKKFKKVVKQKEEEEEEEDNEREEGSTSSCVTETERDNEMNDSEHDNDDSELRCRKSSRSCKGKLYQQFVSGGMLHDLQRPERPFNCKRPWKGDFVSYSDEDDPTVDMETKAVKRRRASTSRRRRASESNIGRERGDGSGRGTDRRSVDVLDYADFDFKAKLDSLPQFTLDQFKPKSRSQTKKKCTNMYKNAVFVKKDGQHHDDMEHHRDSILFHLDEDAYSKSNTGVKITRMKSMPSVTGSRKRKARKRSITHIVRTTSDDGESKVTISTKARSAASQRGRETTTGGLDLPRLSKSASMPGRSLPV
ncbi:uncharacterized protein LOC144439832 [Glandiceps talaboti]